MRVSVSLWRSDVLSNFHSMRALACGMISSSTIEGFPIRKSRSFEREKKKLRKLHDVCLFYTGIEYYFSNRQTFRVFYFMQALVKSTFHANS